MGSHLASCIVTDPIDTVTQVHVFVTGMCAGHQRFYLTCKPLSSLEEAFTIVLCEDFSVMASLMEHCSYLRAAQEPEPMQIDAIEHVPHSRRVMGYGIRNPWRRVS